ncbi:serine/arginine repetitive matrix protein 2 [Anopheles nili]|uniref:serine/arginine repetitive matrix protein 2 n=1 Tax=Anopheles nili TaxID=185578 RepID=UPI00237C1934|nr:serine/arginine repetitive matrix protein 2 [Anopheles nili]
MIQTIQDVNDCVPLYLPHSLYLKPLAKFNISVALPATITGKTISNYDVMEKMRQMILPDKFSLLKVSKSTVGFIRFEGELEDKGKLKAVLSRLDGRPIRLAGFEESVKVRASEAKDEFPTRHDWDSFFRDARNMDEMKAGERPDTIHFSNLPIKWFCPRHSENDDNAKPSESIFKRIFEKFGEVRAVDIPICDPYRSQMKAHMSGMKKFSFDQEMYFEGYVQFSEYVGFVKAMDEFRGMKLVRKEGERNMAITIGVEFDRTKHLSDASTKKRQIVRDRLIAADREKEELEKKRLAEEEARKEQERKRQEELRQAEIEKQLQREQRRKEKHLQKLRQKESDEISQKIRLEEKKLLEAQRKLESIRLLDALFERMKLKYALEKGKRASVGSSDEGEGNDNISTVSTNDRQKKANKLKATQEKELEKMRLRLKQAKDGSVLKKVLSTGLGLKVERSRSPSINTISSDDAILSDTPRTKSKKKHKSQTTSSKKSGGDGSDSSSSAEGSSNEEELMSGDEKVKREERDDHAMQSQYSAQHMTYDRSATGYGPPMHPATAYAATAGFYPGMDWATSAYAYAYDPFYAQYYSSLAYRGAYRTATRSPRYPRGALSSSGVSRGRGSGYRGRGGYDYYRGGGRDDYDDDRAYSRSRSRTRSRSRSRSRSRHRRRSSRSRSRRSRSSRSRSRSRSHRSRSRTSSRSRSRTSKSDRRSRSRSKSRSRSHSHRRSKRRSHSRSKKVSVQMSKPTSKNLVSTIRGATPSSRSRSRSRDHSRSKSRSRSHSRSRSNYKHRSSRRHRSSRSRRDGSELEHSRSKPIEPEAKELNASDTMPTAPIVPTGPIGPRSPPELPIQSVTVEQNGIGGGGGGLMDDDEEPSVVSESFKKHRIIVRTDTLGSKTTKEIEEQVRERLLRQQKERELELRKEREQKKHKNLVHNNAAEEDEDDDEDDDESDEKQKEQPHKSPQQHTGKNAVRRTRNHAQIVEPVAHDNGQKRKIAQSRGRDGNSPERVDKRHRLQRGSGRSNGESAPHDSSSSSDTEDDDAEEEDEEDSTGSSSEEEENHHRRGATQIRSRVKPSLESPDRRHSKFENAPRPSMEKRREKVMVSEARVIEQAEERRVQVPSRVSAGAIVRERSRDERRVSGRAIGRPDNRQRRSPSGSRRHVQQRQRSRSRSHSRSRDHYRKPPSHVRSDDRRIAASSSGDEEAPVRRRSAVTMGSRHHGAYHGNRRS